MSRTAREYVNIEVTYVAENGSSKTCYNTAAEADCEFGSRTERSPCFFRHGAESELMTELIDGELSNGIWNLSVSQRTIRLDPTSMDSSCNGSLRVHRRDTSDIKVDRVQHSLAEDRQEPGIQPTETFFTGQPRKPCH